MEKIDAVAQLIEMRKHNTVAMEGLATIYSETLAKLRMWLRQTGGGAIQRLKRQPWQDASFRKLVLDTLTDPDDAKLYKFNEKWNVIEGPNAGWFTIGNKPLASLYKNQLISALKDEVMEYRKYIDFTQTTCLKYLDWALNATQSILLADHRGVGADYDNLIKDRPQTVAEALKGDQVYWVGFAKPTALSVTKQFGEEVLTIVDVPVKPGKLNNVQVPGITRNEVTELATIYALYDAVVEDLNGLFEKMDRRIKSLKTYREISKVDEAYHRIMTDIDQEMQLYFNVELFSALYSRAGSIQDALGQYLYQNMLHD